MSIEGKPDHRNPLRLTGVATVEIPKGKRPLALVVHSNRSTILEITGARERISYLTMTGSGSHDMPHGVVGIDKSKISFMPGGCLPNVPEGNTDVLPARNEPARAFKQVFGRSPELLQGLMFGAWSLALRDDDGFETVAMTTGRPDMWAMTYSFMPLEASDRIELSDDRFELVGNRLLLKPTAKLDDVKEPRIDILATSVIDGESRVWKLRVDVKDKDFFARMPRPSTTTPIARLEALSTREFPRGRVEIDESRLVATHPVSKSVTPGVDGLVALVRQGKIDLAPHPTRGFEMTVRAAITMPPPDRNSGRLFGDARPLLLAKGVPEPIDLWGNVCLMSPDGAKLANPTVCDTLKP